MCLWAAAGYLSGGPEAARRADLLLAHAVRPLLDEIDAVDDPAGNIGAGQVVVVVAAVATLLDEAVGAQLGQVL